MTRLEIDELDVHDDAQLAAWLEVVNTSDAHERGAHSQPLLFAEESVVLRADRKHAAQRLFGGYADGRLVAAGMLKIRLLDNLTAAEVILHVLPEHRRRGYGAALLDVVEACGRQLGRSRFECFADWPYDGPEDGRGAPGVEFGLAHGYRLGLVEVQREVALPVDDALLDELAAEVADHVSGYEFRSWVGEAPDDDLLARYLALSSRLATEAPSGENVHEDGNADVAAHRISEAVNRDAGRILFRSVALSPAGDVVAHSDLCLSSTGSWVEQYGTLVDPAHRGHRLGLAVKIATLRLLQADPRHVGRRIVTWNAAVNSHMIAINDRLGFVPTGRSGELQKVD